MEAVIAAVPGLAVSLETLQSYIGEIDYLPAARAAGRVVSQLLGSRLSHPILLNINVLFLAEHRIRGIRPTRQGLRVFHSRLDERTDPPGQPYCWIGGDAPSGVHEY